MSIASSISLFSIPVNYKEVCISEFGDEEANYDKYTNNLSGEIYGADILQDSKP